MSQPRSEEPAARRVVPTDDARQGESTGHVRYVLYGSLTLAALAGAVLYAMHVL